MAVSAARRSRQRSVPRPVTKYTIIWEIDNNKASISRLAQYHLLLYGWCRQNDICDDICDDVMNLILDYHSYISFIELFKTLRNNQYLISDTFKIGHFRFNLSVSSKNYKDHEVQLNAINGNNNGATFCFDYKLCLQQLKTTKNAIKNKGSDYIKNGRSVILFASKNKKFVSCLSIFGLNKNNKTSDNNSERRKYENLDKITYRLEIYPNKYMGKSGKLKISTQSFKY